MKTIKIPDEMYNRLKTMAKDYAEQDNRSTAMPYYLQIQTQKQVVAADGWGTEILIDGDGIELITDEDIIEYHKEIDDEYGIGEYCNTSDMYTLKDILIAHHDFTLVNVTKENHYQGVFFTEKACYRHIESNKHHYNEPKSYGSHAFRNPEMELITSLLMFISKNK